MKKKLTVLTGAGISAESGLKTFRDSDGLWNGYRVEEVASPQGFASNPQLVLDFYNKRRAEAALAKPNRAHFVLKEMEDYFNVEIITQNVDDLHERAGSAKVLHLHGQLNKMCSSNNKSLLYDYTIDIKLGDKAEDGSQLRPFIVWFGEDVPLIDEAIRLCEQTDIFVIIGTSLQVYPAAGLIHHTPFNTPVYIIDKHIPETKINRSLTTIEEMASVGIIQLKELLLLN
jgi:NAD-dependent deacetylase